MVTKVYWQCSESERGLTIVVFAWYKDHDLPVFPINPKTPSITTPKGSFDTIKDLSALPHPTTTSLSIITPPKVTLSVLKQAKELGIKAIWMQPGAFDDEGLQYAKDNFESAVAGTGGAGSQGWCVLVDGEDSIRDAEKLSRL
jgi:predicted CoA-binding protein